MVDDKKKKCNLDSHQIQLELYQDTVTFRNIFILQFILKHKGNCNFVRLKFGAYLMFKADQHKINYVLFDPCFHSSH